MQRFIFVLIACGVGACASAPQESVEPESNSSQIVVLDDVVAGGKVAPVDGISSSGQPDAAALEVFAKNNYAAVIDLRGETENRGIDEQAVVEANGMNYLSLPITSRDAINFENARQLKTLIDSQDGPVLIHCGSGNRVGAMLALIASDEGADVEDAIDAGRRGGLTTLEPVVRKRLADQ